MGQRLHGAYNKIPITLL